jgi:predicted HicB family RNase H-like nuclease
VSESDRVAFSVRLPRELHRQARHKMLDDGFSFQQLFELAVQAYVDGDWQPEEK